MTEENYLNIPDRYIDGTTDIGKSPSKEILPASGLYDSEAMASKPFFANEISTGKLDVGNHNVKTTTTKPPIKPTDLPRQSPFSQFSFSNFVIDDLLVFNDYIHYDDLSSVKRFNPYQDLLDAIS